MKATVRIGAAGNGVPVFLVAAQGRGYERPFGATYDTERRLWMYPAYFPAAKKTLADFETLSKDRSLNLEFEFSGVAKEYLSKLAEVERRYEAQTLPPGFTFVTQPFAHQILGLCHAFYMLRSALFFAPGLGKSKCAVDLIRLLHFHHEREVSIVMGPLVAVRNWGKEIDRHSGNGLRWAALLGTPKQKMETIERVGRGEADVLIVTYDTARDYVDAIVEKVNYRTIICDESHRIKDWRSGVTKAAYELGQKASRKLLMTGTPTLGNPLDLYGQFKFLGDYFMPESYIGFKNKFVRTAGPNSRAILGFKNLDVLNARTLFVAIRRTKEECLDLPERLPPVDVEYALSRHQAVIYNQLVAEMKLDLELLIAQLGGAVGDRLPPETEVPHRAVLLNKLLQISSGFLIKNNMDSRLCDNAEPGGCRYMAECVGENIRPYTKKCKVASEPIEDTVTVFDENPKLAALDELLDSILADPPNKVIVWCYYRVELDIVEAHLKKKGWSHVRVDGTTGEAIQDLVDKFNDDPTIRVYLAQISTGVSVTMNSAAYMIYYSLTYSLGWYLQSIDRNYRIGQTKNVTVYRLLGKQTVERAIARLLDNKVDLDTVLTSKLSCLVCPNGPTCADKGIKLFDADCVYHRSMERPVARAQLIEMEPK